MIVILIKLSRSLTHTRILLEDGFSATIVLHLVYSLVFTSHIIVFKRSSAVVAVWHVGASHSVGEKDGRVQSLYFESAACPSEVLTSCVPGLTPPHCFCFLGRLYFVDSEGL